MIIPTFHFNVHLTPSCSTILTYKKDNHEGKREILKLSLGFETGL